MTAVIKLTYNIGQPVVYKVIFRNDHVWIDLHLQSVPGDFLTLITKIKEEIIFKKSYKVVFNLRGIPDKDKTSKEFLGFKESLIKILGKSETPDIDTWLEIIKLHMGYGKYPTFSEYQDPVVLHKIINYMESILNCKITRSQSIGLCIELMRDLEDKKLIK